MSWSEWGLAPLADDAGREVVLASHGRLLILGIDDWQQIAEELSPRWRVCAVRVATSSLVPEIGDLVIWRAVPRDDPEDWYYWGGPTRVLSKADTDQPGYVEVCVLEDGSLAELDPPAEFPGSVLGDGSASEAHDGVVSPEHEWQVLEGWHLAPHCPRCGGASRLIGYGFAGPDDVAHRAVGGCIIDGPVPSVLCDSCGFRRDVRNLGMTPTPLRS